MRIENIAGHKIAIYDSIEDMPVVRFQKFSKFMLIDGGVGSEFKDIFTHIAKAKELMRLDIKKASIELDNLSQLVYLLGNEVSPKTLAFACLVQSIDDVEYNDLSDDGLKRVTEIIGKGKYNLLDRLFKSIKKKIDTELNIYFPKLFDDAIEKEYYENIRRRSILILDNIEAENPAIEKEIQQITDYLFSMIVPKIFTGTDSVEIKVQKQYEDMKIILSQNLSLDSSKMTVLEFYNSYEYLKRVMKPKRGA